MTDEAAARERLAARQADALARLAGLEREYLGVAESAGSAGTDDEHDPEGATLAFERQHLAALLRQARADLAAIGAALRRLDDGSYGVCEECGNPIGAGRLAARPAAVLCITCAARR